MKIRDGHFDRIPQRYSDELWRIIQAMLEQEQGKRVSVDDLARHPRINPGLEAGVKHAVESQQLQLLNGKAAADGGEAQVAEKAQQLEFLESNLRKKESKLMEKEAFLREKELFLN